MPAMETWIAGMARSYLSLVSAFLCLLLLVQRAHVLS